MLKYGPLIVVEDNGLRKIAVKPAGEFPRFLSGSVNEDGTVTLSLEGYEGVVNADELG